MATLESLKCALRQTATPTSSSQKQSLSEVQYSSAFDILRQGAGWATYRDFIFPQLSQLLDTISESRSHISVLEIGPGPMSVLGHVPRCLRQKIRRYTAFEPNGLFATRLEEWLSLASVADSPLPCLTGPPLIHQIPFGPEADEEHGAGIGDGEERYDVILFCHSMYGLKPKHRYIERALEMLVERPQGGGVVVVFHRDVSLQLDGLVCHRTASFPNGVVRVSDDDEVLDYFAPFIAGFVMQDAGMDKTTRWEWRKVCRALGRREEGRTDLSFCAPEIMVAFDNNAAKLPELTAQVPSMKEERPIKNREARLHRPASIVRPTEVRHVQQCVRWARKHGVGLTVLGGGHSGHCIWPNVVSVDMTAFDQVHVLTTGQDGGESRGSDFGPLVIAEAGCKTGDIIHKTMAAGLTVPLGARPSVGAGLWLQGGMGHLARLHGLACDAIIGAILVSVESSQVLCVGHVPSQHRPASSIRPENEADLLWAIKGAGTNFGIFVSVTFKAYPAPTYLVRNWVVPLKDSLEARLKLGDFDNLIARKIPRECSADAYLYWDAGQLHLGVTMLECSSTTPAFATRTPTPVSAILGPERDSKIADGIGLFETEMYVSGMHGGHGGGKTSSFKRCLFLKDLGSARVAGSLVAAFNARPSPLCYLHLLQGGGAVGDIAADATAFGCRGWEFACVITGVWPRDQDDTETARSAVRWVYKVAEDLLPLSTGVYGADLGPDPRDALLAVEAFGQNRPRLARLKQYSDPHRVLPYACPLPRPSVEQKLIILVTGESCAGKDYCADIWASVFTKCTHKGLTARVVSISDATKKEYAAATGADLRRLLSNRAYKEQHRSALTEFFQEQVRLRSRLPEEHFLDVVGSARDVNVLLITGMRDVAPVSALSHLVPDSRLLDVRIQASKQTRRTRGGRHEGDDEGGDQKQHQNNNISKNGMRNLKGLDYCPSLIFDNDGTGDEAARRFAKQKLLPYFHQDLQRLTGMVRLVPDFPRPGVQFRHVLNISQQQSGLARCTSLLQAHFTGDWAKVDVVVSCEAGGLVFASSLARQINVPLVLIREAGKLPPPTFSVTKQSSYISSLTTVKSDEKRVEIEQDVIPRGSSVVVVDDVLSTGETLCAMLQLLNKAGICSEDIGVMVVAEFPVHRGRELLHQHGFGSVNIQSLLVFSSS